MPTYISLLRYTQKGMEHIEQSPGRLDAAIEDIPRCRRRVEGVLPDDGPDRCRNHIRGVK
jgi:uncharacterized protein with GYD domain